MLLCCLLGRQSTHVRTQGATLSHATACACVTGGVATGGPGQIQSVVLSFPKACLPLRPCTGPNHDERSKMQVHTHTPTMTSRTGSACTAGGNVHAHFIDATLDVSWVPTLYSPGGLGVAPAAVRAGHALAHSLSCTRGGWRAGPRMRSERFPPVVSPCRLRSSGLREGPLRVVATRAAGARGGHWRHWRRVVWAPPCRCASPGPSAAGAVLLLRSLNTTQAPATSRLLPPIRLREIIRNDLFIHLFLFG